MKELKKAIEAYIEFYNRKRWHQSLDYKTPAEVYFGKAENRPVDMWTIGVADRLRFPRFPSELGKRGNARLRPHTHSRHSQQGI